MSAEQAKAESTQRGLEDERRTLSMQLTMEREELERAKVRPTNIHGTTSFLSLCTSSAPFTFTDRARCWRSRSQ